MIWRGIVAFRLVTADLDRLTAFYQRIGFAADTREPIPRDEMDLLGLEGAGLRQGLILGPSRLELDWFAQPGRAYPSDAVAASLSFQHLALVTSDAAQAWARLDGAPIEAISRSGPVTLPESAGGVTAVKFRDSDGHPLELLQFPDGAVHGWPGQGVLGIDHSAVSVSAPAQSRAFYEARGLRVGQTSLNRGPTQVALDGLDAVEVDVVPLQPEREPPHLELLGYRNPRPRAAPPRAVNDIASTRIVWQAGTAALVRDPDGHLHQTVAG